MFDFLSDFSFVDLTHPLDKTIPTWEGDCGFTFFTDMDYDKGARVMRYEIRAGVGTHMDAPSHFVKGAANIADISLDKLIVKTYVIDVSAQVEKNDNYKVTIEDLQQFEKMYTAIEKGSLFFAYTGWSNRWGNSDAYRNEDKSGTMHFPGFSVQAADFLLQKDVVGIGIDTLSPDGGDVIFSVHQKMLGAGKYLLENVANLNRMPSFGAYACVAPLKIKDGTEAPVRIVGLVQKKK